MMKCVVGCVLFLAVAGCATDVQRERHAAIPAVKNFDARRYMGDWYEVAHLPGVYEENLTNISLKYGLNGVSAIFIKRGFRDDRERRVTYRGTFESDRNVGEFRLKFLYDFGMLYRVIWVSPNYDRAIVTSEDPEALWILSREKALPKADLDDLVKRAQGFGFDTTELVYPSQSN